MIAREVYHWTLFSKNFDIPEDHMRNPVVVRVSVDFWHRPGSYSAWGVKVVWSDDTARYGGTPWLFGGDAEGFENAMAYYDSAVQGMHWNGAWNESLRTEAT